MMAQYTGKYATVKAEKFALRQDHRQPGGIPAAAR
jgi:hypothetical protein